MAAPGQYASTRNLRARTSIYRYLEPPFDLCGLSLGALVAWGGLGRFIIDGLSVQDYAQVAGGAILVALFSITAELGFGLLEQRLTPGRKRSRIAPASRRPDIELERIANPGTVGP